VVRWLKRLFLLSCSGGFLATSLAYCSTTSRALRLRFAGEVESAVLSLLAKFEVDRSEIEGVAASLVLGFFGANFAHFGVVRLGGHKQRAEK
jgi:hypothetical protein